MKLYDQDLSINGRTSEIEVKVVKLQGILRQKKSDGFYFSKQEYLAWITVGSDNIVTTKKKL
ncbi:MAG: hypothetical protein MUP22_14615 [Desulfobacterales bacterium]|nr:hypothetical protein [Desulfobacterales bacterium]